MSLEDIRYKGKRVVRDTGTKPEYIVVARNRLHRLWLVKIRHISNDKVVYVKHLKGDFEFTVDLSKSLPIKRVGEQANDPS